MAILSDLEDHARDCIAAIKVADGGYIGHYWHGGELRYATAVFTSVETLCAFISRIVKHFEGSPDLDIDLPGIRLPEE